MFYEVYNELGHGFLESVYREATLVALRQTGARVEGQSHLPVWFRGERTGDFQADLIVGKVVIVQLKGGRDLEPVCDAQLSTHLRASELVIGLLLNFAPRLEDKASSLRQREKENLRVLA